MLNYLNSVGRDSNSPEYLRATEYLRASTCVFMGKQSTICCNVNMNYFQINEILHLTQFQLIPDSMQPSLRCLIQETSFVIRNAYSTGAQFLKFKIDIF